MKLQIQKNKKESATNIYTNRELNIDIFNITEGQENNLSMTNLVQGLAREV